MIEDLLEGHQALGLEAHIDHQMLFSLLDDGAGDDFVAVGLRTAASAACSRSKASRAAEKSSMPVSSFLLHRKGRDRLGIDDAVRHGGDISAAGLAVGSVDGVQVIRRCIKRWGFQFGVQVCALGSFRI